MTPAERARATARKTIRNRLRAVRSKYELLLGPLTEAQWREQQREYLAALGAQLTPTGRTTTP